ncbi:hypothetical protein N2152v2_008158 [Parachlorella kessleri]
MSTGFKTAFSVAAFVLALAGALGAEAQTVCQASTIGAPCTSPHGFKGVCQMLETMYTAFDCWKECDASNVGTSCISAFGFTGVCHRTAVGDAFEYGCWEKVSGGAASDPVITGFDGRSFHFDETGNFTLLSSGDGFKVDVTFVGASTEAQEEKCWTSSVRFIAPNGDMVACTLPAIQPNTSRVQVTSMPASSPAQATLLSSSNPSMNLADMTVNAVLSDSGDVTGCQVTTGAMQATVYQVSGYEQAAQHPEEAWAAPYTWLNTDIKLTKPLPAPVTGILGATYPVDEAAEAAFLRALEEPAGGVGAGVVGETGSRRQLASTAGPFFLHSSLVGIGKP